ncbi:hypothetical protein GDO86_001870 [Hymenochirus boettgeri]|uniref:Tantalus-like domain-containing protein n=1 Tax=Hymenochirus boettgeri TaxID=247094 RepID=A0A8T2KHA3_9PIPI|nr:hypothetical protein GDO86_001870 [Hymenochirus boettgeri]
MRSQQTGDIRSIPFISAAESPLSGKDHTLICGVKRIEQSPNLLLQIHQEQTVNDSQNDLNLCIETAETWKSLDSSFPCVDTITPFKVFEEDQCCNSNTASGGVSSAENYKKHNPKNQINLHTSVWGVYKDVCQMPSCQQKDVSVKYQGKHLKSILISEVPFQTEDHREAFVNKQLTDVHVSAAMYALVPYKDLFLDYLKVPPNQCKIHFEGDSANKDIQYKIKKTPLLNQQHSFAVASEKNVSEQMPKEDCMLKYQANQFTGTKDPLGTDPSKHVDINQCTKNNMQICMACSDREVTAGSPTAFYKYFTNAVNKERLDLSISQHGPSAQSNMSLFNTSLATEVCLSQNNTLYMQQNNVSSVHTMEGIASHSVDFCKSLGDVMLKNKTKTVITNLLPIEKLSSSVFSVAGPQLPGTDLNCFSFIEPESADEKILVPAKDMEDIKFGKISSESRGSTESKYSLQGFPNELNIILMEDTPHVVFSASMAQKRKYCDLILEKAGDKQFICERTGTKIQEMVKRPRVDPPKKVFQNRLNDACPTPSFDVEIKATAVKMTDCKDKLFMEMRPELQNLISLSLPKSQTFQFSKNIWAQQAKSNLVTYNTIYAEQSKSNAFLESCTFPLINSGYVDEVLCAFEPSKMYKNFLENPKRNYQSTIQPHFNTLKITVPVNKHKLFWDRQTKLESFKAKPYMKNYTLSQRGVITPYRKPAVFHKFNQDQALLVHLSSIACRLINPHKSCDVKSLSDMMNNVPFGYVQLKARKLLKAFSCVHTRLISNLENCSKAVTFATSRDRLISQHMAVYDSSSLFHSSEMLSLDPAFSSTFPVSFHIKHLPDFLNSPCPLSVNKRSASSTQLAKVSEWIFSLFLSSCIPNSAENIYLLTQWSPHFKALEPCSSGPNQQTHLSRTAAGCSMPGLNTVLALSSPGCYRLWTRKRNLGSRVPTVQRLSVAQFAQGLKGAHSPFLQPQKIFSNMPYILGRVLSTWSQHGPSNIPSSISTANTNCSWQQSPDMNFRNPDLFLASPLLFKTIPNWNIQSLNVMVDPSIAVLPKSCLPQEDLTPLLIISPPRVQVYPSETQECLPITTVQLSSLKTEKEDLKRKPQRVSQIRIRKTVPKPDPNLTPMGLPKPKRLKKKEFSLEDIYTNKNYESPPADRKLETIFEEPKEKNGILQCISQTKRKRILEFRDCSVPRVKRAKVKVKVVLSCKRGRKAALEGQQLDALLKQKLKDLDNFLLEQEAVEKESESHRNLYLGH